jgi:hypothetical protein
MTGWSVTTLRPESWWTRPAEEWVARRICKYLDLGGDDHRRRPWLLTGEIVSVGPDHEPLVADIRPIAYLSDNVVERSRELYEEKFHVGRDSA